MVNIGLLGIGNFVCSQLKRKKNIQHFFSEQQKGHCPFAFAAIWKNTVVYLKLRHLVLTVVTNCVSYTARACNEQQHRLQ